MLEFIGITRVYKKLCNWLSCDIGIYSKGSEDDQKEIKAGYPN